MTTPILEREALVHVASNGAAWTVSVFSLYGVGNLPDTIEDAEITRGGWPHHVPFNQKQLDFVHEWLAARSRATGSCRVDELRRQLRRIIDPRSYRQQPFTLRVGRGNVEAKRRMEPRSLWLDGTKFWRLLHGWTPASEVTIEATTCVGKSRRVASVRIIGRGRVGLLAALDRNRFDPQGRRIDPPYGA